MFLDVTLYGTGIAGAAREILEAWREEHDGYYGRPHGQTPISRQYGGFGFDTLLPNGGLWLTSGLNYHALQILQDGGGVECVRLTYSGRRHGMRAEFARFLQKYWDASVEVSSNVRQERQLHAYVTQEPDWLPWETLDDHHEVVEAPAT